MDRRGEGGGGEGNRIGNDGVSASSNTKTVSSPCEGAGADQISVEVGQLEAMHRVKLPRVVLLLWLDMGQRVKRTPGL